jgi:hypothetical protein
VLASTAYAAGIINQTFFVSLVMLSIITSLAAGSWLERVADRLAGAGSQPQQDAAEVPDELSATWSDHKGVSVALLCSSSRFGFQAGLVPQSAVEVAGEVSLDAAAYLAQGFAFG